jgi:hypothetical protein
MLQITWNILRRRALVDTCELSCPSQHSNFGNDTTAKECFIVSVRS